MNAASTEREIAATGPSEACFSSKRMRKGLRVYDKSPRGLVSEGHGFSHAIEIGYDGGFGRLGI